MPLPSCLALLRGWYSLPLFAALAGCTSHSTGTPTAATARFDAITYPAIDPGLGEKAFPDEQALAQAIALAIEESLRREYPPGSVRRDAHPKAHGCVRAQFQVSESLPASLAQGMFMPGKSYDAWLRFSNGSRDATRPDFRKDAHGVAIKVMGVPGPKLLEDEADAQTQDFILIDHPVFFINDPDRYLSLMRAMNGGFFSKLRVPFALGFKGTRIALATGGKRIANPLQTRYWSMVPYQLGIGPGRQAVKYSVRACRATRDPIPEKPVPDYLRAALRTTLQGGDACMEFLVQPRTSDAMSVEDSMTEWPEAQAPFYTVARIVIPAQVFDTPEQNRFCENLSFTPWHAVPAHKPLGATNRLRKVIYDHTSRLRHDMNATVREEPSASPPQLPEPLQPATPTPSAQPQPTPPGAAPR